MRAVYQRVLSACVTVAGETVGEIRQGVLLFLGVEADDGEAQAEKLAGKVAGLRVFSDAAGKMNHSVREIGGGVLLIPNFTLCGDCRHGRRPEFLRAARPETAEPLFRAFAGFLRAAGVAEVETGVFGADMRVLAENDGPVTLMLNTKEW
ncbi:MAG TPA: D-tyrosyl-tRNA(Tyr) deacylase [Firmicutes bacterium]|nr:D-tyrosyl-tRNA(Tyr) deacylase [Bacillota bacterium]